MACHRRTRQGFATIPQLAHILAYGFEHCLAGVIPGMFPGQPLPAKDAATYVHDLCSKTDLHLVLA